MSKLFVDASQEVAISDESKENTVYVRAKMGRGLAARVSADFNELGGKSQVAYELCLLRYNILRWEGPLFQDKASKPILPTRWNIDCLDPSDPFIANVVETISQLNIAPTPPESAKSQNDKTARPTTAATK